MSTSKQPGRQAQNNINDNLLLLLLPSVVIVAVHRIYLARRILRLPLRLLNFLAPEKFVLLLVVVGSAFCLSASEGTLAGIRPGRFNLLRFT